jgi:hypothetical protein
VKVGDALSLLLFTAVCIFVISIPIAVAFTILLGFEVGSESKEDHAKVGVKELI